MGLRSRLLSIAVKTGKIAQTSRGEHVWGRSVKGMMATGRKEGGQIGQVGTPIGDWVQHHPGGGRKRSEKPNDGCDGVPPVKNRPTVTGVKLFIWGWSEKNETPAVNVDSLLYIPPAGQKPN